MSLRGWVAACAATALVAASCGGDEDPPSRAPAAQAQRAGRHEAQPRRQELPKRFRCPREAANCRSARGTIIYVEAVDPDGDGDAHFVLRSSEGVTFPGISVIDVEKRLRPHPLPSVGDAVSAAGPVYRGSYGQRQIQAKRLRVRRR
jgi:hypothetical protein